MVKEQLPPVTHVDENSIAEFREIDDVVFVAYLDATDSKLIDIFSAFANEHHEDYVFGIATDARLAQADGLPMPSVTCFKIREGDNTAMNGRFDKDALEKFVAMAAPSVIGDVTRRNIDPYVSVSPSQSHKEYSQAEITISGPKARSLHFRIQRRRARQPPARAHPGCKEVRSAHELWPYRRRRI
jgi:hypothetical protein